MSNDVYYCRAHPAISHCSHLLLKCRVATNRQASHWLKVQSRWFKDYIFAKKCILIRIWVFKYCFYYSFRLLILLCHIYSLDACFFFNTIRVSNSLDLDQAPHFVGPDLDPNCLQRQQKSPLVSEELNTKQLFGSNLGLTKKFISYGSNCFHFAKVLATTNSEPAG